MVHVTDREIDLLAQHQVAVAHNPCSNLKLGNGIAPIIKMREKGILVSIGTDGPCSNNSLDMLKELRFAALLGKGLSGDPTQLPAGDVLEMATLNGAKALQLGHEVGSLTPGKKADMIFIDLNQSHLMPGHDSISDLAYAANQRDVRSVMVDGRFLMKNNELVAIDEEKIIYEAQKAALALTQK